VPRPAAGTERLWLTEPRRRTAIAHVTAVRGDWFLLDRSLYCPRSHAYRHPQVADRGVLWRQNGEKRNVAGVTDQDGLLWHRTEGATPALGERVQCHLDAGRRAGTERAHTALHLLLHTLPPGVGRLVADPEVRGGGHIRLALDGPLAAPETLARWRQAVLGLVGDDRPVARIHVADAEVANGLRPQPFIDQPYPGPPETKEAVRIEGVGALPCDGTHADRTSVVRDLLLAERHARRGVAVLVWRLQPRP